jgi:hypothetical protein
MYHVYKAACEEVLHSSLNSPDTDIEQFPKSNDALLSLIQTHDKKAPMMSCLRSPQTPAKRILRDEVLILLRASLFARYRDVLRAACQSQPLPVVEWGEFTCWTLVPEAMEYWRLISASLKGEEENWAKLLRDAPLHDECPMHMDIYFACKSMGYLDNKEVMKGVHLYAESGDFVEGDLVGLIEGGMWHDLAERLCNDLCNITRVVGDGDGHGGVVGILRDILESLISLLFQTNEDFGNTWQAWSPTKKLRDWASEMGKGTILKADVQNQILTEVIQPFNEAREAKAVLKQREGPLERWERMRRDYDKLEFIAFGHQEVSYSCITGGRG